MCSDWEQCRPLSYSTVTSNIGSWDPQYNHLCFSHLLLPSIHSMSTITKYIISCSNCIDIKSKLKVNICHITTLLSYEYIYMSKLYRNCLLLISTGDGGIAQNGNTSSFDHLKKVSPPPSNPTLFIHPKSEGPLHFLSLPPPHSAAGYQRRVLYTDPHISCRSNAIQWVWHHRCWFPTLKTEFSHLDLCVNNHC